MQWKNIIPHFMDLCHSLKQHKSNAAEERHESKFHGLVLPLDKNNISLTQLRTYVILPLDHSINISLPTPPTAGDIVYRH